MFWQAGVPKTHVQCDSSQGEVGADHVFGVVGISELIPFAREVEADFGGGAHACARSGVRHGDNGNAEGAVRLIRGDPTT